MLTRKEFVCIECPNSCHLVVEIKGGKVVKVSGNKCQKGEMYATSEVENPLRFLTSTVLAEGLELKMVPVKTDKPISKDLILTAMDAIKKIKIGQPVKAGDIVIKNFLNSDANLIATREVSRK